jgi:hypothetical protein
MTLTTREVNFMALWEVKTTGNVISFGQKTRKKLYRSACNEPFKGYFWCPERKWFFKEPCPFINRRECNNYRQMCGSW